MELRVLADGLGSKSTLAIGTVPLRTSRQLLLFLFICLMPFQDTILQATPLQRLGSSFSVLPLLALAFLSTADRVLTANLRVNRLVLYGSSYVFAVCLFGLLRFGFTSQDTNLVVESLKLCLETGLVFFVIFGLDYSDQRILSMAVQTAFWIAVFGVAAYDLNFLGLRVVMAPVRCSIRPFPRFVDGRWRGPDEGAKRSNSFTNGSRSIVLSFFQIQGDRGYLLGCSSCRHSSPVDQKVASYPWFS